jgi:hypothetical protein
MKGSSARQELTGFDFTDTWSVVDRGQGLDRTVSYPVLRNNTQRPEPGLDTRARVDVNGNGEPARDTTGNGLLDDVTGTGGFGIADVVTMFERFDEPPVADNPDLFDFNSNGGVGIGDVVVLFRRV